MKLPAGYMGAYEKALIKAGGKPRRANQLDDEDYDSDESDFETPITMGGRAAALINQLDDDSSDDDEFGMCASFQRGRLCALTTAAQIPDEPNPTPPRLGHQSTECLQTSFSRNATTLNWPIFNPIINLRMRRARS